MTDLKPTIDHDAWRAIDRRVMRDGRAAVAKLLGIEAVFSAEACRIARVLGWLSPERKADYKGPRLLASEDPDRKAFTEFFNEKTKAMTTEERMLLTAQIGLGERSDRANHYARGASFPTRETWEKIKAIWPDVPEFDFSMKYKPDGRPEGNPEPRCAAARQALKDSRPFAAERRAERAEARAERAARQAAE